MLKSMIKTMEEDYEKMSSTSTPEEDIEKWEQAHR